MCNGTLIGLCVFHYNLTQASLKERAFSSKLQLGATSHEHSEPDPQSYHQA